MPTNANYNFATANPVAFFVFHSTMKASVSGNPMPKTNLKFKFVFSNQKFNIFDIQNPPQLELRAGMLHRSFCRGFVNKIAGGQSLLHPISDTVRNTGFSGK